MIPDYRGRWTRAAAAHARIVARLREQGHSLEEIKQAGEDGRLAFGYVDELFPRRAARATTSSRPRSETGLEPALIERIWRGVGLPAWMLDRLDDDDLEALRYMAAVLAAGFPLVAFLQVMRVYGHSMRQMADAEARLFRIYVHEPLITDGVPATQVAEELAELIAELLPLTTPLMVYLHRHFLQHAVEQDVIANMEVGPLDDGARRSASSGSRSCFADLVGFVRFTEEAGEEEALDLVERFVEAVEDSLPARRARGQEHRRRRDDRRHRPGRADRLGDRVPGGLREALAARASASTTATRSTGTATTTAATSTSRRASSRARTAARCSSPSPVYEAAAERTELELRADRRGAAEGLRRADVALRWRAG